MHNILNSVCKYALKSPSINHTIPHVLTDTGSSNFWVIRYVNQMFWLHPRDSENLICNQAPLLRGKLPFPCSQPECIFYIPRVGHLQQRVWFHFITWLQVTLLLQLYFPKCDSLSPFFSTALICLERKNNYSASLSRGWMSFGRFSLDTKAFPEILN